MMIRTIEEPSFRSTKVRVSFESNPLLREQEKTMTTSNNLEGEAYDWFLWWSKKCDALSFLLDLRNNTFNDVI